MHKIISKSENDTLRLAEKIGKRIFPGAIILLAGDLGVGKTVFVKGLARGLSSKGLVNSPSYTIMNIYEGRLPLIHFDLYRITDGDEFRAIGADEYLSGDNVCAVEWPEHAVDALGKNHLEVIIADLGGEMREITLKPKGKRHKKWLAGIKNDIDG